MAASVPLRWAGQALRADRAFNIEYRGFLANHHTHAAIAMDALGVDPAAADKWLESYRTQLEPLEDRAEHASYATSLATIDSEIARDGWQAVVRARLPGLLPGAAGSLMHVTIHTGMAAAVGSAAMVAQGLAFWQSHAQESRPEATERADSMETAAVVAGWEAVAGATVGERLRRWLVQEGRVAVDGAVVDRLRDRVFEEPLLSLSKRRGKAQAALMALHGSAEALGVPVWPRVAAAMGDRVSVDEWLRAVTLVVAELVDASRADFFITHALTAWWSLRHLLWALPDEAAQRDAVDHFVRLLAWVWLVAGMRGLQRMEQRDGAAQMAEPTSAGTDADDTSEAEWERIRRLVTDPEHLPEDEHTFKVVFMTRSDFSRRPHPLLLDAARTTAEITAQKGFFSEDKELLRHYRDDGE